MGGRNGPPFAVSYLHRIATPFERTRRCPAVPQPPVGSLARRPFPGGCRPRQAQRRFGSESWDRDCNRRNDRDTERFAGPPNRRSRPHRHLVIDGRTNGGVSVFGSNRRDVLIRARIQANARTEERAEESPAKSSSHRRRPHSRRRAGNVEAESWSVSYEVEVPSRSDLELRAMNGGISVVDVSGVLRLETLNGGIHLRGGCRRRGGGDDQRRHERPARRRPVAGQGTRRGDHEWRGDGAHSGRLFGPRGETGTVNGGINIDFPVTVEGRIGRRITTDLGRGGATIRVITTNGGVVIRRS